MKRTAAFLMLTVTLVSLSVVPAAAWSPAQQTHTVTLASDHEVGVGYHDVLDQKVAYDSTEDGLRFGNYIAPNPRPGDARFRTYIHFDLGALPAGATVQQARLEMYVYDQRFQSGGPLDVGAYRVSSGWTEAGLRNTSNWSWGTLPSFQSTPDWVTNLSGLDQWYAWDVTMSAQAWTAGSAPNHGLMLCESPLGTAAQGMGARSRAGALPHLGPRLVVTYVGAAPPAPTPAPPEILPAISMWVAPEEASPGEVVIYTIRATNAGRDAAVDVVVSDVLPEPLQVITATTTQGTASISGQTVTAGVGVIGHGYVVEVDIQARVPEATEAPLKLVNIAHMSSPNGGDHQTPPVVLTVSGWVLPLTGMIGVRWGVVLLLCIGAAVVILELTSRRRTLR